MNYIINYWGVLASAVASMVIGSIWYGPLFGKLFMREMGMDKWTSEQQDAMKKSMGISYLGQFIASCVMFFVLDWYIVTSLHTGVYGGVANAFGLWLGFVVPVKLGDFIWGGKKTLFWLSIGNMLLTLLVAGAILGMWR
ncbi:MAG: DUF1761 domain-containing protein [Candidatus Vogelbacteria bacterium]|nr:DUF1761 domain-containing protein [Candidatus Vogelbacteria bacterium]